MSSIRRSTISPGTAREMQRKPKRGRRSLEDYRYLFWIAVAAEFVLLMINDSLDIVRSDTAQALFVTLTTGLTILFALPDISSTATHSLAILVAMVAEFWVVRKLSPLGSGYYHRKFVAYTGFALALFVFGSLLRMWKRSKG